MFIITILKPNLRLLWAKPGLWVALTIDPGKHKNKNDYYHNFKILLEDQPMTRFESWVGLTIDLG